MLQAASRFSLGLSVHANSRPATRSLQAASPVQRRDSVLGQTAQILVVSETPRGGAVAAAYAYTAIGWDGLVYVVCGLMGLAGVFLAGSYRAASRRADGPEGSKSGSLSFTISPMTGGCPAPAGMVEPWGKSVSSTSSRSAV